MEQKTSTGRLLRPGGSPKKEEQQSSDLGQLKVHGLEKPTTERGPDRPVREQQRDEGARIRPGRVAGTQQRTSDRTSSRSSRSAEAREQRAQRRQREREAKVREQQRQEAREQAKVQEDAGNLSDEQAAATQQSQRAAKIGDRVAGGDPSVSVGTEVDPNEELANSGTLSPNLGAAPSTTPENAVGLDPDAAVEFAQATSQFANRAKFSQSALVQTILYFFANTPQPDRLDEEEEERILSEISRLAPSEITPEKILELFMLGAISQEAMKRIEEKVLQLGEKAPATKEEIGAIAQKIIKLWKQADEVAFDPRNN
jgi:hypothetical protein